MSYQFWEGRYIVEQNQAILVELLVNTAEINPVKLPSRQSSLEFPMVKLAVKAVVWYVD